MQLLWQIRPQFRHVLQETWLPSSNRALVDCEMVQSQAPQQEP